MASRSPYAQPLRAAALGVALWLGLPGCNEASEPTWRAAPLQAAEPALSPEPTPEPPTEPALAQFGRGGAAYFLVALPEALRAPDQVVLAWAADAARKGERPLAGAAKGERPLAGAAEADGVGLMVRLAEGQRSPGTLDVSLHYACRPDARAADCTPRRATLRVMVEGAPLDPTLPARFRRVVADAWRELGPRGRRLAALLGAETTDCAAGGPERLDPAWCARARGALTSPTPAVPPTTSGEGDEEAVDAAEPEAEVATEPLASVFPGGLLYVAGDAVRPRGGLGGAAGQDPADHEASPGSRSPDVLTWLDDAAAAAGSARRLGADLERLSRQLLVDAPEVHAAVAEAAWGLPDARPELGTEALLLLRPSDERALAAALAEGEARARRDSPQLLEGSWVGPGGQLVRRIHTPDGAIDRHLVDLGHTLVLSNSRALVEAVLDVLAQRAPALAADPDFRAFRRAAPYVPLEKAAAASPRDQLVLFASGAFAAATERLREATRRRVEAALELDVVDAAADVFALLEGRPAAWEGELVRCGLLTEDQLLHTHPPRRARRPEEAYTDAPLVEESRGIRFRPETGAVSAWGSAAAIGREPDVVSPPRLGRPRGAIGWLRISGSSTRWTALGRLAPGRGALDGLVALGSLWQDDEKVVEAVVERGSDLAAWLLGQDATGGDGLLALLGAPAAPPARLMVTALPDPMAYATGLDAAVAAGSLAVASVDEHDGWPLVETVGPKLLRPWEVSDVDAAPAPVWLAGPPGWMLAGTRFDDVTSWLGALAAPEEERSARRGLLLRSQPHDAGWVRSALAWRLLRDTAARRAFLDGGAGPCGSQDAGYSQCEEAAALLLGVSRLDLLEERDGALSLYATHAPASSAGPPAR